MLVGTEDGYVVGSCRSWSGDGSVGVLVEALTQPPGGSSYGGRGVTVTSTSLQINCPFFSVATAMREVLRLACGAGDEAEED